MRKDDLEIESNKTLIILSAKCDKEGKLNSLRKVGSNEKKVIDLQLESLQIEFTKKYVVLGENNSQWDNDEFIKIINPEWNKSNSGYSLTLALEKIESTGEIWVLYSDILFRDIKLSKLEKKENIIYIDDEWETRIRDRKSRDSSLLELVKKDKKENITLLYTGYKSYIKNSSELCGIIKLTKETSKQLREIISNIKIDELRNLSTAELLEISRLNGIYFKSKNISGKYCQLNLDDDLIKFFLGTKAESLEKLRMIGLQNGYFLDQYKFTVNEWNNNKKLIIKKIINKFNKSKIVIRSSCNNEDTNEYSSAGKYESQLSVDCNYESIKNSVQKVIASYNVEPNSNDQVLVQKFLNNVDFSGVAFSRMIESNGPYISINISSLDTTQVTSGNACNEYFIHRANTNYVKDTNLKKITNCLLEIENLLNFSYIDMEFALINGKIYILQVRPLIIKNKDCNEVIINESIEESNKLIKRIFKNRKQIYSLMSDWNPAEIIGKLPSALSSSIYKHIITESNWSLSRKLDNYKNVSGPLLVNILGTDYVDVNKSIRSFIPNKTPETISKKIENKAYDTLSKNPSLHDKLEFEIIPTCIDLNWNKWEKYFHQVLSKDELKIYQKLLFENTKKMMADTIKTSPQISIKDLIKIESNSSQEKLIRAIEYIDKIKNSLAIEFARSARRAFVVTSWLKSAIEKKIISKSAEIGFYKSLHTISSEFIEDITNPKLSENTIYKKYGHLRPSSYDIQSKCYLYRDLKNTNNINSKINKSLDKDLIAWESEKERLTSNIKDLLNLESNTFVERIMKENVILRERNKFEFTKLLSASLELIADYFKEFGFNRSMISNVKLQTLKDIASSANGKELNKNLLNQEIKMNLKYRMVYEYIYKPDIFIKGDELLFDRSINCRPTFIGTDIVEAKVIKLGSIKEENEIILDDKIILIENADPGYDFIFGYKIKGLITMYGGSNSHMTIRCSELNVSAVIGLGHKNYNEIEVNNIFQINPILKTLKKV